MVPNWEELRACNDELEALAAAGKLTRAAWDGLLGRARVAVGEHTEFLEGILMRGAELGFVD